MSVESRCYDLLKKELVPALGCTEPIAIALASAKAREVLGVMPSRVLIQVSGNIIKNVKSVVVPNTRGLKGVEAACITGILGGCSDLELEVLQNITDKDIELTKKLLSENFCKVSHLQSVAQLHIIVSVFSGEESAVVELKNGHANIVKIIKNEKVIFEKNEQNVVDNDIDLTVKDLFEYANTVELSKIYDIIKRQIEYNSAICQEGLNHEYGSNVGKTLLDVYGNDVKVRARALAAAGSDARMSGCSLPVIINSGSGNQGITVSIPVIEFAKELNVSEEKLIRALVLSNLVAIYLKCGIGKLSAYCGVVSASCGAGAGITYLFGGDFDKISQTITNTVANVSGIVCDGAKASCAAKIASSVDAAILGHFMTMSNNSLEAGDGIVKDSLEKTIEGINRLGKDGMRETDNEILNIMLGD
ncbi:MAG: L-serine ammonia-lyase, iron-sulfur-dependent, subunit alpha [Clostridia bacterium]